jgi:hypothetical protein
MMWHGMYNEADKHQVPRRHRPHLQRHRPSLQSLRKSYLVLLHGILVDRCEFWMEKDGYARGQAREKRS